MNSILVHYTRGNTMYNYVHVNKKDKQEFSCYVFHAPTYMYMYVFIYVFFYGYMYMYEIVKIEL